MSDPDAPAGAQGPSPGLVAAQRGLMVILLAMLALFAWWFSAPSRGHDVVDPPAISGIPETPAEEPGAAIEPPIVIQEPGGWEPDRVGGNPPPDVREPGDDRSFDASEVGRVPGWGGEAGFGLGNSGGGDGVRPELRSAREEVTYLGRLSRDFTGGRTHVAGGPGFIGSPQSWVDGITASRRGDVPIAFDFEAPRHSRTIDSHVMDLYEVSNAQYQRYLELSARVEFFVRGALRGTLEDITRAVVIRNVADNLDWEATTRQMYVTNIPSLHAAHPDRVVRDPKTKVVDLEATFQEFREHRIKGGTALRFYVQAPPGHWPDHYYLPGEESHPVRFVSFEEAQAFAHWAGKHVPTEFEWEYAARGPQGLAWPWGGKSQGYEERVNGGSPRPPGEVPHTLPFDTLPEGVSWVGCHHMLGNVSEWTSSFLTRYPGSDARSRFVRIAVVVRGGSAADQDRLRVRPAFRGWRQPVTDPKTDEVMTFEPLPRLRREWTGFRCAVYPEAGRSRMPEMQYWAARDQVLLSEAVAITRYSGAEARELLPAEAAVEAGMFVPQRAFAVTAVPLWRIAIEQRGLPLYRVQGNHEIRTNADLFEAGDGESPLLFGLIQTDFPITGLVTVPGGRLSTEPKSKFVNTGLARGTYFVGMVHGRVGLISLDLTTVAYFASEKSSSETIRILKRDARADGRPAAQAEQRLEASGGRVWVVMEVPLGGGAPEGHVVRLRFRYDTARGLTRAVMMPWREHTAR